MDKRTICDFLSQCFRFFPPGVLNNKNKQHVYHEYMFFVRFFRFFFCSSLLAGWFLKKGGGTNRGASTPRTPNRVNDVRDDTTAGLWVTVMVSAFASSRHQRGWVFPWFFGSCWLPSCWNLAIPCDPLGFDFLLCVNTCKLISEKEQLNQVWWVKFQRAEDGCIFLASKKNDHRNLYRKVTPGLVVAKGPEGFFNRFLDLRVGFRLEK